jgi:hypothetical protein
MNILLACLQWALLTSFPAGKQILQAGFSPWLYVVPIALIAFIVYYRKQRPIEISIEEDDAPALKPAVREVVEFNRYAGGHPEINELVYPCLVLFQSGMLQICKYLDANRSEISCVGTIPLESILEIRVEDVFTMKRKMTPESWRISKKHFEGLNHKKGTEVAFTVIEWMKDNEHRSTYLCIEDDFAMEIAVKKRNAVLQKTRHSVQMA